jgi:hypothetical protein
VFSALAFGAIAVWPAKVATQQVTGVRPRLVEPLQNLDLSVNQSRRPAYLPAEWGRLISVQRLNEAKMEMFLQADNGDIYLVRLAQQGEYLYLDTTDQGGVALVLRRQP